jgi:hypothetical protein
MFGVADLSAEALAKAEGYFISLIVILPPDVWSRSFGPP